MLGHGLGVLNEGKEIFLSVFLDVTLTLNMGSNAGKKLFSCASKLNFTYLRFLPG